MSTMKKAAEILETSVHIPNTRKDFSLASGASGDIFELEAKALLKEKQDGPKIFDRLKKGFAEKDRIFGQIWSKTLFSSYFSHKDRGKLGAVNDWLRVRYRLREKDNIPYNIDISSKSSGLEYGDSGTIRIEPETDLPELSISLPHLFEAYEDNPFVLKYLKKLSSSFDNDPNQLRETFYVKCHRTTFNVCVYAITHEGKQYTGFKDQLNGDTMNAKPVFFEFALDNPSYHLARTGETVGEDWEIEFEFKRETDKYAPAGEEYQSDPTLNAAEITRAQEFLATEIKQILPDIALKWQPPCKQNRALTACLEHARNIKTCLAELLLDTPTILGKTVPAIAAPDRFVRPICVNDNPKDKADKAIIKKEL